MLVLSRKKDEELIITVGTERIVLTVAEIRGDKVRIGVTAAKHISIHRKEIQDEIDRDRPAA